MLHLNPENNKKEGTIFRNDVNYTSSPTEHTEAKTNLGKPDPRVLIANYTTELGAKRGSAHFKKISDELLAKEIQQNKKDIKEFKKYGRRFKRRRFLKSLIPLKVRSFAKNRPEFTPKKIYSYLRAEFSNIEQGSVSLPVYEERKKICGECPHRKHVEGYKDPLGFCTKCGCGANPRAQLTVKLKLPATSCPIGKWGEAQGIYEGFWGRIRYILRTRRK